eukprot:CAMPEP_0119554998 /NCGR_PEP_ID=MMETSP1352-20130426/7333_1 /TAXON_ID=265584 /ORGANISM="Stauroneis constricta, Strain CCMP1120" /LENGTH=212 /DNA_ID=CAMNT_0007601683 /DNA_START=12 /DNA_END=650 /DNA_ORIENTATION=+
MASFGDLVLVLGDYHIPHRASTINEKFKRMLVPNKMQHVICTGNIQLEQYTELCTLAPSVTAVRGDMDIDDDAPGGINYSAHFPESSVVQVGCFRIGVIHGHQLIPNGNDEVVERMRRKLDVDVMITGHTHKSSVRVKDGYYYINPGSITGASSSMTRDVIPSFVLLAIQGEKIVCYLYELKNGEVDVSKTEFVKPKVAESVGSPLMQELLS